MPGTVYFLVLLPIQFPTIAGFSSGFLAIQESAGTGRGGEGREESGVLECGVRAFFSVSFSVSFQFPQD